VIAAPAIAVANVAPATADNWGIATGVRRVQSIGGL
jgi:hypothetical protein